MAISIDTRSADGRIWKHQKYDADDTGQRALAAAIAEQRALGHTVSETEGGGYTVEDQTGTVILKITYRRSKGA